jgi:hypothetical protein
MIGVAFELCGCAARLGGSMRDQAAPAVEASFDPWVTDGQSIAPASRVHDLYAAPFRETD